MCVCVSGDAVQGQSSCVGLRVNVMQWSKWDNQGLGTDLGGCSDAGLYAA